MCIFNLIFQRANLILIQQLLYLNLQTNAFDVNNFYLLLITFD